MIPFGLGFPEREIASIAGGYESPMVFKGKIISEVKSYSGNIKLKIF